MTFNEYQDTAKQTAIYDIDTETMELAYLMLGLNDEAGECAAKLKKHLRGDYELDDEKKKEFAKELGDVLWYIANSARVLGFTMDEVAEMNLEKLLSRKERGVLKGNGDNR
jgi:NTP pyrophosphatase (non-canonical NTP hydrolase)